MPDEQPTIHDPAGQVNTVNVSDYRSRWGLGELETVAVMS